MKLCKDTTHLGPFCKDCEHIGSSKLTRNMNMCKRPIGTDIIDGSTLALDVYCRGERSTNWFESRIFGMCGKEGRYFEVMEEL